MKKQEKYDKRLFVNTTDSQLNEVKKVANDLECTLSFIVREFIHDGLLTYRNLKIAGKL